MAATDRPPPGLALRIEQLMREMGFTCDESFSIAMRVQPGTVARWRRGEERPAPPHVAQMARFRGVTAEEMGAHLDLGYPLSMLEARAAETPTTSGMAPLPELSGEHETSNILDRMLLAFFRDSNRMQRVSEGLLSIIFDKDDPAQRDIIAWALERGGRLRDRASQETLQDVARGSIDELRAIISHAAALRGDDTLPRGGAVSGEEISHERVGPGRSPAARDAGTPRKGPGRS